MLPFDEAEAAGLCECGVPLATHPPLPRPKPLTHGRPCEKAAFERGYGWDGSPAPELTDGQRKRWGHDLDYASPKAHRPTAAQQPVIVSRAAQVVR